MPADAAIRIVVHLPKAEHKQAEERGLAKSLENFFNYRAEMISHQLKELFRQGSTAFAIGLVVLSLCLFGSQMARSLLGAGPIAGLIEQSLIILGWVANWRPLEIYLYDWWPIARRRDLYRRLGRAEVRLALDERQLKQPSKA